MAPVIEIAAPVPSGKGLGVASHGADPSRWSGTALEKFELWASEATWGVQEVIQSVKS